MRRRTFLTLAAAAPFFSTPAFAAEFSTPLAFDSAGRPLLNVTLNGQGPFPMVVDTGAAATGLSPATIERLALQETGRARVQGASGVTEVPLYQLASVGVGGLQRERLHAAVLPNNPSAEGHAGVLGANTFLGARVTYDFAGNAFRVDDGEARAPLANAQAVTFRHRTFAFFPVRVNNIEAQAVLDTGARRSVANVELRAALGFTENDTRFHDVEDVGGATTHSTNTVGADIGAITIAGHNYGAFELAFADLPVFRQLGLTGGPGLILGMDILRRARSFTLDYTSGELVLAA